jgi:hypothetical protein
MRESGDHAAYPGIGDLRRREVAARIDEESGSCVHDAEISEEQREPLFGEAEQVLLQRVVVGLPCIEQT